MAWGSPNTQEVSGGESPECVGGDSISEYASLVLPPRMVGDCWKKALSCSHPVSPVACLENCPEEEHEVHFEPKKQAGFPGEAVITAGEVVSSMYDRSTQHKRDSV
jgi:hypothetical protein